MPFLMRAAATAGVLGSALGTSFVDTCHLPSETGLCKAHTTKWFHNSATNQCETFVYGGCGGNANNFASQADCRAECKPTDVPSAQPVPVCEQAKVVGPCRAAHQRWWHNSATGQCDQFTYGGCQGNANNFLTQDECQGQCPAPVPVCEQPAQPGLCRAAMTMWYHDAAAGECKTFVYGGCGGNDNMFNSKRACKKACTRDECALPAAPGPCRGAFQKYFFNKEIRQCEQFVYGGCQGNANSFDTLRTCENRCGDSQLAAGRPAEAEGAKSGLGAGAVAGISGAGGALVAAAVAACMVVARKRSEDKPCVATAEEQLKAAADV